MPSLFNRYATPFITGLFLVSLISGLALFFHIGPSGLHGMHEWLSLVLILPFGLHVWKNWRPMLCYLRRAPMAIASAISLVAALAFLVPLGGGDATAGGPPPLVLANRVMAHSATELAPLLGTTPEALIAALTAEGFTVTGAEASLGEAATASGKSAFELAAVLNSVAP